MTKFICTGSYTDSVSIGQIVYGLSSEDGEFIITKDTNDCLSNDGEPKFKVGETVPLNGLLWRWREVKEMDKDQIFDIMMSQCKSRAESLRFYQSEPKLQANHFDGYATFIIAQACGMRDEPQVHTIHLTEEQAREMAYEILEQLNKI